MRRFIAKETEPLLAGTTFPTLADLVSADLYAGQARGERQN